MHTAVAIHIFTYYSMYIHRCSLYKYVHTYVCMCALICLHLVTVLLLCFMFHIFLLLIIFMLPVCRLATTKTTSQQQQLLIYGILLDRSNNAELNFHLFNVFFFTFKFCCCYFFPTSAHGFLGLSESVACV